jgi:nucleotide-binding universal stress UspA family protein
MRPDLIVIGTHGRSTVARALVGSVAESLLRTVETDVLAVPPGR